MKKLLDFVPVDIIPFSKGFICAQKVNVETAGTKIRYIACDFSRREITSVTRSVYLMNKFGTAFKEISGQLADPISCAAARISGERTVVVYPNGEAGIFDKNGKLLWTDDLIYKDEYPVSCAAADGAYVWCVARNGNAVLKYSVSSKRFAFRIGSKDSPAFLSPYHVVRYGQTLYVSCPGSHQIKTIDAKSFEVSDYRRFEEPVYKYLRTDGFEIVLLSSGIYVL